jgi:hypothetical protein
VDSEGRDQDLGPGGSSPPPWNPPPEWAPPGSPPPSPASPAPSAGTDWAVDPYAPTLLPTAVVQLEPPTRRALVWETRVVMIVFIVPGVAAALIALSKNIGGVGPVTPFPNLARNPVANLLVGIFVYLASVAAPVPLALYLLSRTGQRPRSLGLAVPGFRKDIWPACGLILASVGSNYVLVLLLLPLLEHKGFATNNVVGHVPPYYVVYGIAIAATTAVTEEVLVNGYLLVRLEQLGWSPGKALTLSLLLRTSYHVYYGVGFVLTVPFGYFVTRSFQKNRRLTRPIFTHFLYDAILFTIAVLA